jgi:hypothetical protein
MWETNGYIDISRSVYGTIGGRTGLRGASSQNKRTSVGSQDSSNHTHIIDIDSSLDYRQLGKSTRCNVDHSRFHCILPYTSLKQQSMKLQYVRYLHEES